MMLKEVCVENFTKVPEAIEKGARRVELCDNLAVGGTTVSPGVARVTLDYCRSRNVKVMSMIRPRGGDFVYNVDEIKIMKQDIIQLKEVGTDGVVFGCLTQEGWIDEEAMITLLEAANDLEVVFHMAFDAIPADSQLKAIDWLVEHGVHRILTHGGPSDTRIEDNVDRLKMYIEHANGRIAILPGGGVTSRNLEEITSLLGVKEAHGTRIVD
ncbi:copper homeostasis protein CutC [Rossellomorea marisflavi]|uniref:copper homeostasis protein CutC n=1 Tax=Rossellomorea marisflavi TaxID=189381 RepID=UPI0025AED5CB|nr:copper homeostasis protein CutC [Rossellomorea marisflavi]WJV21260.1 copper homeostasis protein CutC [Rossellomorea marisflavi]